MLKVGFKMVHPLLVEKSDKYHKIASNLIKVPIKALHVYWDTTNPNKIVIA